MAKWIGNDGVEDTYPSARLPSTTSTEKTTTNFPADRVTHMHHSPKGEDGPQEWQYRSKGREGMDKGPKLDRAIPRATIYDDGTHGRFGAVGSGAVYGGTPDKAGKWDSRTGKSTERSGSESFSDDDSFSRRYGGSGLGKSG